MGALKYILFKYRNNEEAPILKLIQVKEKQSKETFLSIAILGIIFKTYN